MHTAPKIAYLKPANVPIMLLEIIAPLSSELWAFSYYFPIIPCTVCCARSLMGKCLQQLANSKFSLSLDMFCWNIYFIKFTYSTTMSTLLRKRILINKNALGVPPKTTSGSGRTPILRPFSAPDTQKITYGKGKCIMLAGIAAQTCST